MGYGGGLEVGEEEGKLFPLIFSFPNYWGGGVIAHLPPSLASPILEFLHNFPLPSFVCKSWHKRHPWSSPFIILFHCSRPIIPTTFSIKLSLCTLYVWHSTKQCSTVSSSPSQHIMHTFVPSWLHLYVIELKKIFPTPTPIVKYFLSWFFLTPIHLQCGFVHHTFLSFSQLSSLNLYQFLISIYHGSNLYCPYSPSWLYIQQKVKWVFYPHINCCGSYNPFL